MFSKKTRNLTVAVLALIMALTLSFGLFGFNTQANAATETANTDGTVTTVFDFETAEQSEWKIESAQTNNSSTVVGFTAGGVISSCHNGSGAFIAQRNGAGREIYYATSSRELGAVESLSFWTVSSDKNKTNLKITISKSGDFTDEIELVAEDTSNNLVGGSLSNKKWTQSTTFTAPANDGGYLRIYLISGSSSGKNWGIDDLTVVSEPVVVMYNVTYNYNDGETENLVEEWMKGDAAITLEEPTRLGYTFLGWNDGTTTYAAGAQYTPTANVTLTAQWSYDYVNVTVDGVAEEVEKNTAYTLTIPTQEGKNFLGWSYANDNTPTILPANPTVNVAEADITLYTCWSLQDGLLIYNSIDNNTVTAELVTNPTVSDYATLFGAVDEMYTFEKWVDANGIEYALGQAVTGTTTVQLFPVFKVASYEYPALEVWTGETFDMATLPTEYNGFAVTWAADATVADKYVGTLTAKDHFNVAETVLTQTLSRFNYTVAEAYDFGTLEALGLEGVNAVLPKTVKLTGSYTNANGENLTREQEFALTWNTASITDIGTHQLTATVVPVAGFEVTGAVTTTVNVKNAKQLEFVFDFENDGAGTTGSLTEEEWATIPGFSGTGIQGAYGTNALKDANGNTYPNYLDLQKVADAELIYTLSQKAYVTEIEVDYAGGTSSTINLIVTVNYADGTTKVTNLATNGNWVLVNGKVTLDSTSEVTSITFTKSATDKNMAIKRIKVTYVSLLTDTVMTLDVNGGDALPQTTFNVKGGNSFTLPTATRAATADAIYNLTGWLCGEKLYKVGEELVPEENMTFVAQWDVIALNTPVTGVTLANNQTEVLVNGAVNYPTTVTATYGEGKTVELALTLADGQSLVDTAVVGVYTLTYNVDNMNGFYALGEFGTVTFTVTVYEWKVTNVETVNLTVKQGTTLNAPATVNASVQKWNGAAAYGEVELKAFAVTWEAFDTTQEIRPGYTMLGTLTAENGYNLGEFANVTANVEINNFEYSAVQSVLINNAETYAKLADYGYTVGGNVSFDKGDTDAFLGAKLANGGFIQFTLAKETHIVIGVSSTKATANVQFGSVAVDTGAITEIQAFTSFSTNYQVIDTTLAAGTYKIINNATDNKSNVSVTYIQVLDGGSKFFIPNATTNVAPENTDKSNFVGWTDGTTLYTKGASMPAPSSNKGIIAYEPYYGETSGFGTVLGYTLLGYYQESTLKLVSTIDTTVATTYTAINAKATWTDGAALRIAGASKEAADDTSALKFILNLEFTSNVAALVNNLENNNITFGLENAGEAQFTLVKTVADAKNLTVSLYVEKVASLGLINNAIAPKVSLNGSEYVTANAYTAKFIAQKALADAQAELLGDYKFLLSDNTYSRFNDTERTELQKYIDLAPATGGDSGNEGGDQGGDSGEQGGNSSEQGGDSTGGTSTGSDEPTTSSDDTTTGSDEPTTSTSTDEPTTGSDSTSTGETSTGSDEPTTSTDQPTTGSDSGWSSYH